MTSITLSITEYKMFTTWSGGVTTMSISLLRDLIKVTSFVWTFSKNSYINPYLILYLDTVCELKKYINWVNKGKLVSTKIFTQRWYTWSLRVESCWVGMGDGWCKRDESSLSDKMTRWQELPSRFASSLFIFWLLMTIFNFYTSIH